MSLLSNETLAKCIFENDLSGVEEQLALAVRINGFSHYDFAEQTRLYDTMVTIAVKHADLEILIKILKCGFDVNESDDSDLTPLMLAVMCEILLNAQADPSITSMVKWSSDIKESALQIAERLGHTDIVNLRRNHKYNNL